MTHWKNEEANRMEAQIWGDLGLLFSKTKHGFNFLYFLILCLFSYKMISRQSCQLTENQNFGDCKHFETTGQMNFHEIYCLQYISAQPTAHMEACNKLLPCTGTISVLTYLLCKETDMAWWGVLAGCLLFCQLLHFCCYHTGTVTSALGRSLFCIFVHPGWAPTLPTWTAMETYQTNISMCLMSNMSDSQPADHRHTKARRIPRRIQNTPILPGYCPYEQLAIPSQYSLYHNVSNGTYFQRHWQLLPKLNLQSFSLKTNWSLSKLLIWEVRCILMLEGLSIHIVTLVNMCWPWHTT